MTWRQLAHRIHSMTEDQQHLPVRFVADLGGEGQMVFLLRMRQAEQNLFEGITVGNVLVLAEKDWFLEKSHDRV